MPEWMIYFNITASIFWAIQIIFSFLWYRKHRKLKNIQLDYTPTLSVVVPVFNESSYKVQKVLDSILMQRNVDVEVVVIDDGSFSPLKINTHSKIKHLRTDKNHGKRHAQIEAIKHTRTEWIVTVDSDTILKPDALYELYKAAMVDKLDAVSGVLYLHNENHNLLTKMTACLYWYSFFQERASQSYFKSVICCAGALSMYKKTIVLEHKKEYLEQKFLGYQCHAGDDRFLTCLFAISGKSIGIAGKAEAYTTSPDAFNTFVKQQLRWSRSHIPAMFYLTRRIFRCSGLFTFFMYRMTFRYVYFVVLYCSLMIRTVAWHDYAIIPALLGIIVVIGMIKGLIAWLYTHESKFLWLLPLSLFSFFILTPVIIFGAFTPTKTGWLTRQGT